MKSIGCRMKMCRHCNHYREVSGSA
uniref:Alpha-2 8-sialyltransferase 8b n=1 Tax=Rhizophora mucronata TaxID=61149 RepID=A0A2P2L0P5_RHIMU